MAPLLLLPGLSGTPELWDDVRAALPVGKPEPAPSALAQLPSSKNRHLTPAKTSPNPDARCGSAPVEKTML